VIFAALALLLLALLLVTAELFLPSHGLLAIFAGIAALASVFIAYRVSPGLSIIFGVVIVIATPIVFYFAIKIYPSTSVGKRVLLDQPAAPPAFDEQSAKLQALVGRQAVAATTLRPAGIIEINGQRIDAMSESEIISAGTTVEIVQVTGLKVIVKPV
jgi:membrane-bound ClpP family serine protease